MAENEAEQKAGGGLVKKLLIFGGGGSFCAAEHKRLRRRRATYLFCGELSPHWPSPSFKKHWRKISGQSGGLEKEKMGFYCGF